MLARGLPMVPVDSSAPRMPLPGLPRGAEGVVPQPCDAAGVDPAVLSGGHDRGGEGDRGEVVPPPPLTAGHPVGSNPPELLPLFPLTFPKLASQTTTGRGRPKAPL